MIQQAAHAKIEDLFVPDDNGHLSYFYASNKVISNPRVFGDILRDFPDLNKFEQQKVLKEIIIILQHITTNSYILNQSQQPSILEIIIDLIPNYAENYSIFNKLLTILDWLLKLSSTDEKLIEKAIKKLQIQFHSEEGSIQSKSIFAAINIVKSFLNCKINMDKQPEKMIPFHGGNGLEIRAPPKKQINWGFSNGMSIYFWLNIQNIKFGTETSLPKLFTFYSPNNGGLQCYLIDNKIYYRTVGSKYNSPKIGSNGICLGEIEPKKWNFIGIEHEGPKRLLGRSHIAFYINDKKSTFNLSPPSISSKQKMKMVFFDKIYCKSSSVCIFPFCMEGDFVQTLNKNKNSIDLIKNPKAYIFQERQGGFYQRNDLGYCPDPILHRCKSMTFENYLPLFHIYKYAKNPTTYPILNQLLSLFVLFLYKSPLHQVEAYQKNYLHIISELVKSLPNLQQKFNEETVNTLLHIKQTITNPDLLKQYHGQLLWGFIDSNISISNKQMLLELIKNNFTQNVSYYSYIVGLDQILNSVMKLSSRTNRCCQKHYKIIAKRFDKDFSDVYCERFGENQQALEYLLKIIELEVQNQKVNTAQQIYKLCRLLSIKFSPCFTLSFMAVIRRILTEKVNEKLNGGQAKKIIDFLVNKKVYLMFIHVIQNTFFAQIKAESIRILYTLLLKKVNATEQEKISSRLSKAIWKINEDDLQRQKFSPEKNSFNKDLVLEKEEIEEIGLKKKTSASRIMKMNSLVSDDQQNDSNGESSKNKASSIFKQVGPQAPQLTNKMKNGKSFNFNFVNVEQNQSEAFEGKALSVDLRQKFGKSNQSGEVQSKKKLFLGEDIGGQQIMEEEKTNENQIGLQEGDRYYQPIMRQANSQQQPRVMEQKEKKIKKKPKSFTLNIDTEQINKMYTFGGEKGQQIVISQQQKQAQMEKIRKLARICVAAMKKQKYEPEEKDRREEKQKKEIKEIKVFLPPSTTSNKALRARQMPKIEDLKLISEQESEPESAVKKMPQNIKNINTSLSSPKFGSKKSKSPTSMGSINEENMAILYNSLMQSCISIPNYNLVTPSIMYIFFSWIPQTNLEVKFLFDLSLILENDQNQEKIRVISKMAETYDFLFELTYKALLFEEMGQKRLYTEKLEQIIKKIYTFVFRDEPESLDKFSFILDWSTAKFKQQYHPKCLFLTSRYVFFLIMDAIEEDLFTNSQNDRLMERNFQHLGIVVSKFCKFLPIDPQPETDYALKIDQFGRIIFQQSFGMLSSIAPYFTSPWVDYLICQKYYILFKKFFCTDWYRKNLKMLDSYFQTKSHSVLQTIITTSLSTQLLILQAQSQYYLRNSFVFTLIDINRLLFIQKCLRQEQGFSQKSQILWQTTMALLFAESTKQRNQKNNSDFTMSFLKNCKTFCSLDFKESVCLIELLQLIRDFVHQNNNSSGMQEGRDLKSSQQGKFGQFVQFMMQNYVNENLFEGNNIHDFQNFKLNFNQAWIPGENHQKKMKSDLFSKLVDKIIQIEDQTPEFIQHLSNLIEQETERATNVQVLQQTFHRNAKNGFRKIWKNLRTFGSAWTHPDFSLQNDTLFNKNLFTYERLQPNKFFKWKICKHLSKYRLRTLLKPVLFQEPRVAQQGQNMSAEKLEVGLHNALLYYNESKLLLGKRVLSWLFTKQSQKKSADSPIKPLEILMQFKKVRMIKTLTVRHGHLGIINDKLIFIYSFYKEPQTHLSIAEYKIRQDKNLYKVWPLQFIKQIFKKRYVNRKRAIELNFIYGKSVLFDFYENDHEDFVKKIIKLKSTKCPNLMDNAIKSLDPKKIYDALDLNKKWNNYQLSNFEYLLELNNLGGRSYSDLTQYPVMPWVYINYVSKINFSDQTAYRNLSLPMGALGSEQRTEGFRERFENMGQLENQKFHYGTHYSSPAIIYHFLVRISPFTQGSILLQSGKFDFADRLFFSIMDSFKNATSEYSDVRQLIPQMYTFPEAYLNLNKLDLGVMQSHKRVHNIELPLWARDNPYLFVTKMRKAFQQVYVSKNINKWIDLIFGFKQRGEQAIKNLNCFVHLTYQDSVKFEQMKDDKTIKALQTQIVNFGQTPTQIFTKPHQQRVISQLQGTICDINVQSKIYRPSRSSITADLLREQKQQFNALRQSGQSIIHMKWFKDSRLVYIRKNGQMIVHKLQSAQTPNSRVPFQCSIQKQKSIQRISKNFPENLQYFDGSLKSDSFPIQFINNGHHIALGGQLDGKLLIIDTDSNSIQTYIQHSETISAIKSDSKDNFLITGDIEGRVVVWRISNNHKMIFHYSMKDHRKQITSIFICYDLRFLFTSSMDGAVYGYNIITGKKMRVLYHPKLMPINHVIVSINPLPVIITFSNLESIIYCYSLNGQLIQRVHEKEIEHFLSPIIIRDSFGFEHVAYGSEHGQTIFRTLPFLDNPIKHLVAKQAAVNRICLSKSNKFVIIGCSDGQLSVIASPDNQIT